MKPVRTYFLVLWSAMLLLLCLCYGYSHWQRPEQRYQTQRVTAQRLLLTDLCLSTESRHTRHISMPEWFAPFQDLPGYHDHFPSSSFFQVEKQPHKTAD